MDNAEECLLIADDSVLSKHSAKRLGSCIISVLAMGMMVDYRIYDKQTDGKTKNSHFCDMLSLALAKSVV